MPNLRGASPVGRGRGRRLARGTGGRQKIDDVGGASVWLNPGRGVRRIGLAGGTDVVYEQAGKTREGANSP